LALCSGRGHYDQPNRSLKLTLRDRIVLVREGDIERVAVVYNNAEVGYSYSTYYLTDGDSFILSGRVPRQEGTRECCSKISYSGSYTRYGIIP
jgi:enterochelin esterase-like enzyme